MIQEINEDIQMKLNQYNLITLNIKPNPNFLNHFNFVKEALFNDKDKYNSLKNYFIYCIQFNKLNDKILKFLILQGYDLDVNNDDYNYGLIYNVFTKSNYVSTILFLIKKLNQEKIIQKTWNKLISHIKSNLYLTIEDKIVIHRNLYDFYKKEQKSNITINLNFFFENKKSDLPKTEQIGVSGVCGACGNSGIYDEDNDIKYYIKYRRRNNNNDNNLKPYKKYYRKTINDFKLSKKYCCR